MSKERKQSTEAAVREIRRRTRRKFSPEEKVRIVLEGRCVEQAHPSHRRQHWAIDGRPRRVGRSQVWRQRKARLEESPSRC
jgi:hypothetical protein